MKGIEMQRAKWRDDGLAPQVSRVEMKSIKNDIEMKILRNLDLRRPEAKMKPRALRYRRGP